MLHILLFQLKTIKFYLLIVLATINTTNYQMHGFCISHDMDFKRLFPTLLAFLFVSSCTSIREPEFRDINNFRIKNLGLTKATIGFTVTYFNPNNFGVTVKETDADVYIDSVYLGKFAQDSLITVGKNAAFSIPISGTIPLGTFLKLNLQDISNRQVLLKAAGSTKIGKGGIYITKSIEYEGKHRLNEIRL
ncbi:MAG TPA: LEA type 2 family protein [Flavisolibacter sp.]|nr:LEA type 2 family protein [Flavisolibacter sp.]